MKTRNSNARLKKSTATVTVPLAYERVPKPRNTTFLLPLSDAQLAQLDSLVATKNAALQASTGSNRAVLWSRRQELLTVVLAHLEANGG